jgi:hypothetical protein
MNRTTRLNANQQSQIRTAWAQGAKQYVLAEQFGVSQAWISKLVEGIPKVRANSLRPPRCCKGCGTPLRYKTRCQSCNRAHRNDKEKRRQAALRAARKQSRAS